METSSRKKLGKLGILTKENAPDWFRIMESHLRGEKSWKVIQDVIGKRKQPAAATPSATTSPASSTPGTPESSSDATPDTTIDDELKALATNEDWDAKNWKAIEVITLLLSALDRHTVQAYKYAGDIWAYLKKFYEQTDRTARMIAMRKVFSWQKDSKHSIKQAGQEICYLSD